MDIAKFLREEIKKCKRKMNLAKLIDYGIWFAAAGGIFGMACELASLVWRFYYVHLAAGLCFAAGFLAGAGYAVYKRADMRQAARRLDSFGLKERMLTAYELMEKEDTAQNELVQMQRQDAFDHYNRIRGQIKIPLFPDKRHVLALALSAAVVIGMGFIPSMVREQAQIYHQVQEQVKEEQKKLDELVDALEGIDLESLTEEQKARLQELTESMKLSQEELAKADSWESLATAMEKLDYKYQQAGISLGSLASQLNDPAAAGVATAEALAKAAANPNGQQMASSGTPSVGGNGGDGDSKDDSSQQGESGDGSNSSDGNSGEGNSGSDGGNGGSGDKSGGTDGGSGDGDGSGDGNGSGEGNGSGNGGNGNGTGNGRGTGSSDTPHDYVSIPNAAADDPTLTGNKNGDQDSDYFRQQNGLAWEGEHVDYNSVIGQYTENAYEGIASGKYPSGMESVIRDYFGNLNK